MSHSLSVVWGRVPEPGSVGVLRDERRDTVLLLGMSLLTVVLHSLTNSQYGFHRDELAVLDDARHLDWGFVAYPPLAPATARVVLELFGPSLVGVRLFGALAVGAATLLTGLMVCDLGGSRWAQCVGMVSVAIAPIVLLQGSMFQYVGLDYLWWVVVAYGTVRMVRSEDPHWWLLIGAGIGLGLLTKYTMAVFAMGLGAGVLLTSARRFLLSRWVVAGAAVAFALILPNVIWQAQHGFVALEFLSAIHARDVASGRTQGFLPEQLIVSISPFTVPLWGAGLWFVAVSKAGTRYRPLAWMYAIPCVLLVIAEGRSYYLAPAYPMLLAAGAVAVERWRGALRPAGARALSAATTLALTGGGVVGVALFTPVAPINSPLFSFTSQLHDNFVEQVGWQDLVETVVLVHQALPGEERSLATVLAANYGEAGALNLYGEGQAPRVISGVNSYWQRGYGDPPLGTIIAVGFRRDAVDRFFAACVGAGLVTNRHGVRNEETRDHPMIFVCREPRQSWPELWPQLRRFG